MGVEVMEKACDQILGELSKRIEPHPEMKVAWLLLDGSSLRLEHTEGVLVL